MRTLGLKEAFFLLTLLCLALSLLLAGGCWVLCDALGHGIPSGGVTIDASGTVVALAQPTPQQARVLSALGWGQILACLFLPVLGLGAAGAIFYHWKLKRPIALLREGTERILRHELDFSLPAQPQDELGQLCAAFETLRAELLRTNWELWRQAEERKRLNAAFSHDLRNPITVLKGSLKPLRQGVESEQALRRKEDYTARMCGTWRPWAGSHAWSSCRSRRRRCPCPPCVRSWRRAPHCSPPAMLWRSSARMRGSSPWTAPSP